MKKLLCITLTAVIGISLLCACGKSNDTEPVSAVTEQPQATQTPEELIIGSWTVTEVTGFTGTENASAQSIIENVLQEGASITITDDKKIKFGILSADYTTEGNDTLTVSSSLLPSSIEIKYTVDADTLTATFMDKYTAKCTRND